jgi:hypothetical protein
VLELLRGELVRLHDRDDPVHARRALEIEVRDPLAVTDCTDHGQHRSLGDMRGSPDRFHLFHDRVDLVLRRALFHHDHHQ